MDKPLPGVGPGAHGEVRALGRPAGRPGVRRGDAGGALIDGLRRPGAWPHAVRRFSVIQTHVSWVVLTGSLAYKIKKPVNLGFLDFSTLALRRAACEAELRLNRRWAPDLYLDVVPIAGTRAQPRVGGEGPAIEYAVCMRQFRHADQLDRRLAMGLLQGPDLNDFARALARAHAAAPVAPATGPFGTVAAVQAPVANTLAGLRSRATGPDELQPLVAVERWLAALRIETQLTQRLREGFVREVHGDLHLGNLVRRHGVVQAFDCIEFDPALRWIDVLSDVAFLAMDLACRGRPDLAARFLNRYLEHTGDYAGLAVLRYYLVYRALVRANIASIRRASRSGEPADTASVRAHLALARQWTEPAAPALVLMHGLSGSGKTRLSEALVASLPAIRLRSDLERRRAAPDAVARDYGAEARTAVYGRLAELARAVLAAGEWAIVDATFIAREERGRFRALAQQLGVPCVIVDCDAPAAVLAARVAERARTGADASEADPAVLAGQLVESEPFEATERALAVTVDTSGDVDFAELTRRIRLAVERQRAAGVAVAA